MKFFNTCNFKRRRTEQEEMHFYFDMINLRENIAPATGQLFFQNDVQYLKQKKIFKTRFEKI